MIRHSRLTLELLEPRMLLDGAPLERGSLLYDDGVDGNLVSSFTRDISTIDDQGILREVDERRFGTALGHAPFVSWTAGESPITSGIVRPLATGWDQDGLTPLLVLYNPAQDRIFIFKGDDFEFVGSISFAPNGLPWTASEGKEYKPTAAIVYHGLIVIMAERLESVGGEMQTVGTSFLYTQDYGASVHRVAQVGGGFDVPAIADDVSQGKSRGRQWAFLNPFPVHGLDDTEQVWFPWADYIAKIGEPKGGQIGLFQAVRNSETGIWTVHPNRLVYEVWIPEDAGGLHSHTAAVTLGGVVSHWGDVGYRNQVLFHEFDLSNYQTAPITTRVVYGGYDSTGVVERKAPQPGAAAPAPTPGEHFASGDETLEMVLRFGALQNGADELTVSAPVDKPMRESAGNYYVGTTITHLQWMQGRGYISGAVSEPFYHYSPDGITWAAINRPEGVFGRAWIYGSKLLMLDGDNRPWTADLPKVSNVNPLQIAPGGTNRLGDTLPIQTNLGTGNVRREVEYIEGSWRYADDLQPLTPQPSAPPFPITTPVYEVTLGPSFRDLGTWWLQPVGSTLDASRPNLLDLWVYNLGSQSVQLGTRLRVPGVGSGGAAITQAYESNQNFEWVPLGVRQNAALSGEHRFAVSLTTSRSGKVNEDARFLIAPRYFGELNTPPYPLAPLATGSNELEVVSGFQLQDHWSAGIAFQWPSNALQSMTGRMPIGSLRATNGAYVEFAVQYTSQSAARVIVELVRPGYAPVTINLNQNILRGDIIEVAVSRTNSGLTATARVGGSQPVSGQASIVEGMVPVFDEFAWASGNGATVTTINPLLLMIDDEFAWTAEQQIGWLRSTLDGRPTLRVNPYPGDYNFDGIVDQDDLAVWQANLGSTSNLAADGDWSGVVDQADFAIWEQYLGTGAIPPINLLPGDFDFNGIVDLADLTVWEATVGSKKYLNADANRDGIVDLLDRDIWEANLGMLFPVPPQPLPGDYNFDGVVNAADYVVWRDTVPSPYKLMADGDGNGSIGDGDRVFWMSQFGNKLPPEESGGGAAAVSSAEGSDDAASETSNSGATAFSGFATESRSTKQNESPRGNGMQSNRAKMLLALDAAFASTDNRGVSGFARNYRNKSSENEGEFPLVLCDPLLTLAADAL